MRVPLAYCDATTRLKGVLSLLRCVSEEGFLTPFTNAVRTINMGDPRPGYVRLAAEIDRIEQSFRQLGVEIQGFLAASLQSTATGGVPLDENDVLGHLQLTKDDMNFLAEIADIMPPITDAIHDCSTACRSGEFSLREVSARVAGAATIVSRGTERFHPCRLPVLQMLLTMWKTEYSIDQFGRFVKNDL
jgi:hypothetical protein